MQTCFETVECFGCCHLGFLQTWSYDSEAEVNNNVARPESKLCSFSHRLLCNPIYFAGRTLYSCWMTPVRVVAAQIFILLLFICHVIISCFQVTTAEVCKHFLARLSCKAKFKPRTPHFYQSLTIKKTSKLNFSEIKVNISISTRFGIFTTRILTFQLWFIACFSPPAARWPTKGAHPTVWLLTTGVW